MARAELPPLSDEEQQTIASICQDVLFDAWNEDSAAEDINYRLQQLWETALRFGFVHGQGAAKKVCREETHVLRAAVAKEMEAERVWGYDVGWKLRSELLQTAARSMSAVAAQVEPGSTSVAAVQTEPAIVPEAPLDWVEDAAILPIPSPSPRTPSTPPLPRDFSALSSGSAKPFASLQRRLGCCL
ncbi:hypothetical protein B0H14DRAFT_3861196 [Mycena olivaceomarginata]|jgi:hypothetical protein|nr:hypothetical protein B0H14DRAFT_3861196 [Mycena olivaceomarginata]